MNRTLILAAMVLSSALSFATPLSPPNVIELHVIGSELTASNGSTLTVPADATAATLNVTSVNPKGSGFITIWPCGVERPLASNLNYIAGAIIPNGVIAPIGSGGSVCFYSSQQTDLVVDVSGWFAGTSFVGATPQRLIDTRDGTGTGAFPIGADSEIVVQARGIAATTASGVVTTVPASTNAVALNVTVVNPSSSGFLTVYPCDALRPLSSNVNYSIGKIVANGVIAPVSSIGTVCIYSLVRTDIVVDLAGWFPGSGFTSATPQFTSATPQRIVDTRDGTGGLIGKLSPSNVLIVPIRDVNLTVGGVGGQAQAVPSTVTAAALNVTVTDPGAPGFATVFPCDAGRPTASNLNFVANDVIANNVIAPTSAGGTICLFTSTAANFVVDISGYFAGGSSNAFVGATPKRFIDTRINLGPAPGNEPPLTARSGNFGSLVWGTDNWSNQ